MIHLAKINRRCQAKSRVLYYDAAIVENNHCGDQSRQYWWKHTEHLNYVFIIAYMWSFTLLPMQDMPGYMFQQTFHVR